MDVLRKLHAAKYLIAALAIALAGCSSPSQPAGTASSEPAKPAVKPPEALTGRLAVQKLYVAAHTWQADAQPFMAESKPTKEFPGIDGKSAVWTVHFGSKAHGTHKAYTWSGITADDAPERGVTAAAEDSFSATNSSTQVFDLAFLSSDSDQAFKTAQEHGLREWMKKAPGAPLVYQLRWDTRTNALVWRVSYGADRNRRTIDMNASTGKFMQVEK